MSDADAIVENALHAAIAAMGRLAEERRALERELEAAYRQNSELRQKLAERES